MNELMSFDQKMTGMQESNNQRVGAMMATSREAQEVMVSMYVAKQFPRDTVAAYGKIMQDCQRVGLAEKAMYEYPRGGQMVTGPSVHLARAIARSWGNLDAGYKVLEQTSTESVVMAYCWDKESNFRDTKIFTVPHVRDTKNGRTVLTDARDIYETIANQAARRVRACILTVIPQDVLEDAIEQCTKTLAGDTKMPLPDMVRSLVKNYGEQFGVTQEMLEKFIGVKADAFTHQSAIRLKNVYNTLRDGSAQPEQYFEMDLLTPKEEKPEKKGNKKDKAADAPKNEGQNVAAPTATAMGDAPQSVIGENVAANRPEQVSMNDL